MKKHRNTKSGLITIALGIIICAIVVLILTPRFLFPSLTIGKNAPEGEPYRFFNQSTGMESLTDYCVKDEYAYLLFEDSGILNVYDLSGKCLHSFAYYNPQNGRSELHVDRYRVYLQDRDGNIYSFMDGRFESFYKHGDKTGPRVFSDEQKRSSPDGVQFKKRWASVIALMPDGTQKPIVSRPFFLVFAEPHSFLYYLLSVPVVILVYILVNLGSKHKKNTESKTEDGSVS